MGQREIDYYIQVEQNGEVLQGVGDRAQALVKLLEPPARTPLFQIQRILMEEQLHFELNTVERLSHIEEKVRFHLQLEDQLSLYQVVP